MGYLVAALAVGLSIGSAVYGIYKWGASSVESKYERASKEHAKRELKRTQEAVAFSAKEEKRKKTAAGLRDKAQIEYNKAVKAYKLDPSSSNKKKAKKAKDALIRANLKIHNSR